MKTSSFFSFSGEGRICVARYAPRRLKAGYRIYRRLAPGSWFNSVSKEEYERLYQAEVLDKLNPQEVWDELHKLANGAEPVLLCYEKPPFDDRNFCHRRLIAAWLERELGVEVPEI
jgi:hypothetical protein